MCFGGKKYEKIYNLYNLLGNTVIGRVATFLIESNTDDTVS